MLMFCEFGVCLFFKTLGNTPFISNLMRKRKVNTLKKKGRGKYRLSH